MDKDVINRTIAEKLFGLKDGVDFGEIGDHVWKLDEDGDVDIWVLDIEFHNGPGCVKCKYSYCMHSEIPTDNCSIEVPDYFSQSGFDSIVEKLTENGLTVTSILRKDFANVSILRYGKLFADSDGYNIVEATALATYEYLKLLK